MNRILLSLNNNIKKTMRSVSCNYLALSNFKYPYIFENAFEVLESELMNLTLNKLEKRKVLNANDDTQHSSNKPQRESRSCIT
jgi:hypothetical protein